MASMLLLLSVALAQDPPADAPRERSVSVATGAGVGFVLGGNGAGYGVGLAEHVGLDFRLSRVAAIQLDVDHSHHRLGDASGYFPDLVVPADSLTGTRDYLLADAGVRVSVDLARDADPDAVRPVPFVRFGGGAAFSDTKLTAPAFSGQTELRSRLASPMVSVGVGVELKLRQWLSLTPHARFQAIVARDDGEIDAQTAVGVETRGQAILDVVFNF